MKSLVKNLLFLFSLGLIIWFGYIVFYQEEAPGLTEDSQSEARIKQEGFLAKLKELDRLHIDTTIFGDKDFRSLVDFTVPVIDEEAGRPNPFAPVPGLVLKAEPKK